MCSRHKIETVLVVDDLVENVDILISILSDKYRVKAALNGKKALDIARSDDKPDLILLDIVMPEMDGFAAAQLLQKDKKTKEIPIIFVTGDSDKESTVKAFQLGAKDYVTKPYNPEELLARVATHLELQEQRRQLESMNQILEEKVKERTSQLEFSLIEKENLLQELQHRVKNNLQIISSLLKLQSYSISNKETLSVMKAYLNRVQAMAIVHEMVGSEHDLRGIDFGKYIRDLMTNLVRSMGLGIDTQKVEVNIHNIKMNVNVAIPCGLALNDLIAFIIDDRIELTKCKKIRIELEKNKNKVYSIFVGHDGKSIGSIDWDTKDNFKIRLIGLMVKQLGGKIEYKNKEKLFTLNFKEPQIKTYNPVA